MMRFRSKLISILSFGLKRTSQNFASVLKLRPLRASAQARVEKLLKYKIPNQMKNKYNLLLDPSSHKATKGRLVKLDLSDEALAQSEANGENAFSESKPGFTLIEVLLSLAIIGMVLTPIFLIQQLVLRRSSSSAHLFSRLIQAKDFLVDQQFENIQEAQGATAEKKITNPPTTLIFSSKKLPENSSLKKFKHIMVDSVTMQWIEERNRKRQEKLVTFSFKPEESKQ